MASVYDKIRQAFEVELNSATGLPTQIAWENVTFEPTTGTSYMRPKLVPIERIPSSLGDNFLNFYRGIYEIMVYCPKGNGPSTADDFADRLLEVFDPPKTLTVDDVQVQVRFAEREQGMSLEDSPFYYIPVVITWFCYH